MTGPEAIGGGNLQGFSGSTTDNYWTVSQDTVDPDMALTINIVNGVLNPRKKAATGPTAFRGLVWPVRNALLP